MFCDFTWVSCGRRLVIGPLNDEEFFVVEGSSKVTCHQLVSVTSGVIMTHTSSRVPNNKNNTI